MISRGGLIGARVRDGKRLGQPVSVPIERMGELRGKGISYRRRGN